MPAELQEQIRLGLQSFVNIETGDRAARTFPDTVPDRHHQRRTAKPLQNLRAHDPNHAGMPILSVHDQRHILLARQRLHARRRLFENLPLNRLALHIQVAKLRRQPLRLLRRIRQHQFHAQPRVPNPSRRIEPRRQAERNLIRRKFRRFRILPHGARRPQKRRKPANPRPHDFGNPLPGQNSVFPRKAHHIRDRPERHQLRILCVICAGRTKRKRPAQRKRHPAARQILKRIRTILLMRIHHRDGARGQNFRRLMMIRHDEIHPVRIRINERGRRNPAIHRHQEPIPFRDQPLDSRRIQPVPLRLPRRNVETDIRPESPEISHQNRRRRDPVHIIIPVDANFFLFSDGHPQPRNRRLHPLHQKRIGQILHIVIQKMEKRLLRQDAAPRQNPRNPRRNLLLGKKLRQRALSRFLMKHPLFILTHPRHLLILTLKLPLFYHFSFSISIFYYQNYRDD